MLAAALSKARPFDLILTRDQARFGRSTEDVALRERLRTRGVGVDNILNPTGDMDASLTPGGELIESIQSSVDVYQRKSSTVLMIAGQKAKAKKGELAGAQATCYGYRQEWLSAGGASRPVRVPKIDKQKARIVREMFRRYIAGDSLKKIKRWLDESGLAAPRGREWWEPTVRKILSNETYLGRVVYGKIKKVKHPVTRNPVNTRNDGEVIRVDNAFPAIIDQETFDKAQAILSRNESTRPQGGHPGNTLRGIGKCTVCEKHLAHQRNTNTNKWYYMCGDVKQKGARRADPACKGILQAEYVDEVVRLFLTRVLLTKATDLRAQVERYNAAATQLVGLSATEPLELALREHERTIANLVGAIGKSGGTPALLDALEKAEVRLADLRQKLTAITTTASVPTVDLGAVMEARSLIKDVLRKGDRKHMRAILAAIVAEVRCDWSKRKSPDVQFNYLFEDAHAEPARFDMSPEEHDQWQAVIKAMGSNFRSSRASSTKSGRRGSYMSITMPRTPLTFVPKWSLDAAGRAAEAAVKEISEALASPTGS